MREMTIQDVQFISMEILKDIHEFCEKNKIFYTLCGGSLIGAIRHNGFIPWDDDIDIAMPRPDYDRFIKTYKSEKNYCLFSRETESENDVYLAYSRVCEMDKTYVDSSLSPWCSYETGVWIDIMPLDGANSDEKMEARRWKRASLLFHKNSLARSSMIDICKISEVATKCRMGKGRNRISNNKIIKFLYFGFKILIAKLLIRNRSKNCDRLIKICRECDYVKSDFFTDLTVVHYGMREYNPKLYLRKRLLHNFGESQFYIIEEYDSWLRHIYGDYMKLPPVIERNCTHESNIYYWK